MKCLNLFSAKSVSICRLLNVLPRVLSVKPVFVGMENRVPFNHVQGAYAALQSTTLSGEESQCNQNSDFRYFMYSLFPRVTFIGFIYSVSHTI